MKVIPWIVGPKELVAIAMELVAEWLANKIVCCSFIPLSESTLGDFELCWDLELGLGLVNFKRFPDRSV